MLTILFAKGVPENIIVVSPEIVITLGISSEVQVSMSVPETIVSTVVIAMSDPPKEFTVVGAAVLYYLTITGSADGESDIDIPMSSFQARRRNGEPTYLQCVVPSVDFAGYITDRSNGTMRIDQAFKKNGEILQREKIIETSIDDINTYQGGSSESIVLIGYTTESFDQKSMTLHSDTYKALVNGKVRYRLAKPEIFLNPGDIVTIGLDTITVGVMSYSISINSQQMEVEEA